MDWLDEYMPYGYDVKVADFINNVLKLRLLYRTTQYSKMQEHISDLMRKYPVEMMVWNSINTNMPQSYEQMYQNAEAFLQAMGVKLLTEILKP